MIRDKKMNKGFTLVELLLAMSIVSMLLLAIATMTIQMVNIMDRGATYRDLSVAGRAINTDLSKTFNSLSNINSWNGQMTNSDYYRANNGGFAFCTGTISYLWNNNTVLSPAAGTDPEVPIRYAGTNSKDKSIRLVKVNDAGQTYCRDSNNGWSSVPRDATTTEVLSAGESSLQIYEMRFSTNPNLKDAAPGQTIVNISYILGTPNNGSVDFANKNCTGNTKDNYCAINKFELTVRTLGQK